MEQESLSTSWDEPKKKKKMTRDELTVEDGTSLDLAVSAMIKELRRGKEYEALYWARQLEGRYYRYLWRRLMIFCAEDVGLANPDAIVQVVALREAYMLIAEESASKRGDINFVAQAVYVLARSPKSKEVGFAWMNQHMHQQEGGWGAGVPGYAIDVHTKAGRELLSGEKWRRDVHWFTEAQIVTQRGQGGMDYELWWARQAARKGVFTIESVEGYARFLDEKGLLEWGTEGVPFLPNPYVDPSTGEVMTSSGADARELIWRDEWFED